jgi:hypothetical protein
MTSVLKPKKAKTIQDIKTLEKLVSSRHNKTKTKMFFGEFIPPNELLKLQPGLRLDLIVRDLAVGHLLGENNIGLDLYKRLGARTRVDYETRVLKLRHLMKSFKEYGGYDVQYPVPVSGDYQILGGAHRIVLSKRYNILEIPIMGRVGRIVGSGRGAFHIRIMKKLGYTTEEMEYILGLKDEYFGITQETR